MKHSLTLFIFILFTSSVLSDEWNYDNQNDWSGECSGSMQSPINIDIDSTVINQTLDLAFKNYDIPLMSFSVVNNGHSVQFTYIGDASSQPQVSGSALNNQPHALQQLHFHWGLNPTTGSEHTINDKHFSIEMHLVHYNLRYSSFQEALQSKNGVVVLGVFIQIDVNNNINFDEVIRLIGQVANSNVTVHPQSPIEMSDLLPGVNSRFYRYSGSLTTPPCTEGLTWIVFDVPTIIGVQQYEVMRKVINLKTKELVAGNNRVVQDIGSRRVEASFLSHNNALCAKLDRRLAILLSPIVMAMARTRT